jgi:hypothetical protein
VVNGAGVAAEAAVAHPRTMANAGINRFIGQNPVPQVPCFLAPKSIFRQNSPIHHFSAEKKPADDVQAETAGICSFSILLSRE